jgi:hypothetical protein
MARFNIFLALLFAIATGGVAARRAHSRRASLPRRRCLPDQSRRRARRLVWGDERLQRSVRVLPDGTFAFPLVGQVVAAGRLPSELERIITAGLQPQYRGQVPQVTVSVKNPTGFQFSVVGKVKGPGTFTPGPLRQRAGSVEHRRWGHRIRRPRQYSHHSQVW